MGLGANLAEITAKGLAGTVFNGIFGNNNKLEDQEEQYKREIEEFVSYKNRNLLFLFETFKD